MGNKGKWEYLRAIYGRYRLAGRQDKNVILSEFCANTGYHRKYAIRLLNGPRPERRRRPRERRRGVSYGLETLAIPTAVWEAAGYPWSVRLKALLPGWMPSLNTLALVDPLIEGEERERGSNSLQWWSRWDSNPRPPRCHRGALPTAPRPHRRNT